MSLLYEPFYCISIIFTKKTLTYVFKLHIVYMYYHIAYLSYISYILYLRYILLYILNSSKFACMKWVYKTFSYTSPCLIKRLKENLKFLFKLFYDCVLYF